MTTIRVYNGGGASVQGTPRLVERLKNNLDANVLTIGSEEISASMAWAELTDVIIFGAWTVRGFKKALGQQGLTNLYNAVADKGVTYGGVCAGAAFAASKNKSSIVYDIIEDGKRKKLLGEGIGFYEGYARGPIKAITGNNGAFQDTIDDIHVIDVVRTKDGTTHKAAYWSGPMLIPFERGSLRGVFQTTSYFKDTEVPLSMVGTHGHGRVVLYSFHPEITMWNWRGWIKASNPNIFQQAKLNQMDACLNGEAFNYFIDDLGLSHLKIKKAEGLNLSALL